MPDELEQQHGLATTKRCAQITGRTEKAFVMWASRHGIEPHRLVKLGRARVALYSLDDVLGEQGAVKR